MANVPPFDPNFNAAGDPPGYPLGYTVTYAFGGGRAYLFQSLVAGRLSQPTSANGDATWKAVAAPIAPYVGLQVVRTAELQGLRGEFQPGRLYIIIDRASPSGETLPDVRIRALTRFELEPTGYTLDGDYAGVERVPVGYELATDTTAPVPASAPAAPYRPGLGVRISEDLVISALGDAFDLGPPVANTQLDPTDGYFGSAPGWTLCDYFVLVQPGQSLVSNVQLQYAAYKREDGSHAGPWAPGGAASFTSTAPRGALYLAISVETAQFDGLRVRRDTRLLGDLDPVTRKQVLAQRPIATTSEIGNAMFGRGFSISAQGLATLNGIDWKDELVFNAQTIADEIPVHGRAHVITVPSGAPNTTARVRLFGGNDPNVLPTVVGRVYAIRATVAHTLDVTAPGLIEGKSEFPLAAGEWALLRRTAGGYDVVQDGRRPAASTAAGGGLSFATPVVHSASAELQVADLDKLHLIDSSNPVTLTLPAVAGAGGREIAVQVADSSGALHTVRPPAGSSLDGRDLVRVWAGELRKWAVQGSAYIKTGGTTRAMRAKLRFPGGASQAIASDAVVPLQVSEVQEQVGPGLVNAAAFRLLFPRAGSWKIGFLGNLTSIPAGSYVEFLARVNGALDARTVNGITAPAAIGGGTFSAVRVSESREVAEGDFVDLVVYTSGAGGLVDNRASVPWLLTTLYIVEETPY